MIHEHAIRKQDIKYLAIIKEDQFRNVKEKHLGGNYIFSSV